MLQEYGVALNLALSYNTCEFSQSYLMLKF